MPATRPPDKGCQGSFTLQVFLLHALANHLSAFVPMSREAEFRLRFSSNRESADLIFFAIHSLVSVAYFKNMKDGFLSLQSVLMSFGSLIPSFMFFAFPSLRCKPVFRSLIIIMLKWCMTAALVYPMDNDFTHESYNWVLFLFKLWYTGRIVAVFAVGLGLQLPLSIDVWVQTAAAAAVMATAVPRQCQLGKPAPGPNTLFYHNKPKFEALQDYLDWPFSPIVLPSRDVLHLPDRALCVSVYFWMQLVGAVGVPLAALYATETAERRRFLSQQQQPVVAAAAAAGDGEPGGSSSSAGRSGAATSSSVQGYALSSGSSRLWTWVYFLFGAQVSWCVVRSAATLLA